MPFRREGSCLDCGECCGTSGDSPFPRPGWESIRAWSLDDINLSYPLYSLFDLGLVGEDAIGIINNEGSYRVKGKNYYFTWQNAGKGTIPMKDTSIVHDGSSYSVECPFLMDDPGDGSRPCALVGSQDDGNRKKYCRPEERGEYVPAEDIWEDSAKEAWEADHPNCSYTWVSV